MSTCGRFYHDECSKNNVLFRRNSDNNNKQENNKESSSSSSSSKAANAFVCPLHACVTCWCETRASSFALTEQEMCSNITHQSMQAFKGRLLRCIRCPTAYHDSEHCIAAGSIILSNNSIICPAHFQPLKGQTNHVK